VVVVAVVVVVVVVAVLVLVVVVVVVMATLAAAACMLACCCLGSARCQSLSLTERMKRVSGADSPRSRRPDTLTAFFFGPASWQTEHRAFLFFFGWECARRAEFASHACIRGGGGSSAYPIYIGESG